MKIAEVLAATQAQNQAFLANLAAVIGNGGAAAAVPAVTKTNGKAKAQPTKDATIVETVKVSRLRFDGKPTAAQRQAMKDAGGFAARQDDVWYWYLPVKA